MSIYRNTCGRFGLELTDPSPMWLRLQIDGIFAPGDLRSTDLYDLKHLVDRAIIAAEAKEQDLERLHSR